MIDYTSQPNGGFSLTTQAPQAQAVAMPGLSPMGGDPNAAMFLRLAQRRMAQERALRLAEERRRQEAHDLQLQTAGDEAARRAQAADQQRDASRFQLEKAQYIDQLARAGQPLRPMTNVNASGGYTPDTQNFNAYQREMFLPGGSSIVGPGNAVPTGSIESPDMEEAARSVQNTNLDNEYLRRTQAGMGGYRGNRVTGIGER